MSFEELFPREPIVDEDEPETVEEEEHPSPPWFGPPRDELGVTVAQTLVLARSARAVVALSHLVAHSTGVVFQFVAEGRSIKRSQINTFFHVQHGLDRDEPLPAEFLRLGVELADGTRAANLGGHLFMRHLDHDQAPETPVFLPHGGGGGSSSLNRLTVQPGYWLWPLPPSGPLRISVEWPALEVELASVEIDATMIRTAAGRARPLWATE